MPENRKISAATSFLAQVTSIGEWRPENMRHAAVYNFIEMHKEVEVTSVEINVESIECKIKK